MIANIKEKDYGHQPNTSNRQPTHHFDDLVGHYRVCGQDAARAVPVILPNLISEIVNLKTFLEIIR